MQRRGGPDQASAPVLEQFRENREAVFHPELHRSKSWIIPALPRNVEMI